MKSEKRVKRAYKFRFYPDTEQANLLARTFGCVRFVYNRGLAERTRAFKDDGARLSYNDTSALLTQWKRDPETEWLGEVSSVPLQQSLRHLNTAFMNFWAKTAKYPTFNKRGKTRDSAEFTYRAFTYTRPTDGHGPSLTLAKTTTPLNVVWHRDVPADVDPTTATVSRDAAGRWFVSLLFDAPVNPLPAPINKVAGVDMGQIDTVTIDAIDHDGAESTTKTPGLMPGKTLEAKLAKAQRLVARKRKGSKNRAKAQRRVARLHAKIADQRRDHLHKIAFNLVRENQAIGIEDLCVRDMTASNRGTVENPGTGRMQNRARNRRNADVGYRMLRTNIEYKADWYDRDVVLVDRYYPSSRICSTKGCDHIAARMPVTVRTWTCPTCGAVHDRDENAATNLRAAATAVLACGDGVRLRGGKAAKQNNPVGEAGNLKPRGSKPGPSGPGS